MSRDDHNEQSFVAALAQVRDEPVSERAEVLRGGVMYEDDLPEDITQAEYDAWYAKSWVDGVRLGPVFPPRTGEKPPEDWILKAARLAREMNETGDSDPLLKHLFAQEELHRQQLQKRVYGWRRFWPYRGRTVLQRNCGMTHEPGLADCMTKDSFEVRAPFDLRKYVHDVTLELQHHRERTDAQKDALFQRSYALYVKYNVDKINDEDEQPTNPPGEWTREPPSVAGWYWDLARGPDQTARVEVVNAEYARALERRNAVLVEALREMPCPGPLDDNKDECAGWCVDHGDCGCAARPALAANGAPL